MKTFHRRPWPRAAASSVLAAAFLTACGGGGSEQPAPATQSVALAGVVATGAAAPNAAVNARCATGTGSATSAADGSYTLTLSAGAVLPCVLEAVLPNGGKLHSVTADAGSSVTTGGDTLTTVKANVTPVTELAVAALAGADPAAFFAGFDSAGAAKITDATVAAANTAVVNLLKPGGVDLSTVGNVFNAPLTAATSTAAGNAYDQALDTLAAKLVSSGNSLPNLVQNLITNPAPGLPKAPLVNTPLPPAELALADAAANCTALRSGAYRVVAPRYSDISQETTQITIDAKTLKVSDLGAPGSAPDQWMPNGECRYLGNFAGGQHLDVVVTQAGVLLARRWDDTDQKYRQAIAFPEQVHTVAELAGDWNMMGRELVSGTDSLSAVYTGVSGNVSIAADGTLSNITRCQLSNCQSVTGQSIAYSLNPTVTPSTGGFTIHSSAGWSSRAYVYRAGGGELMQVEVWDDGTLAFWTRKTDIAAPVEGSRQRVWNAPSDTSANAGVLSDNEYVNGAASGSGFGRVSAIDGHPETLQLNTAFGTARSGYVYRPLATSNNSAGSPVTPNEFTSLPLRGMGLSPLWLTGLNGGTGGLLLSAQKPEAPGTASVALELLGKTYAPTCAALRSGTYRVIRLHNGSAEVFTSSLNAATLTFNGAATPNWTANPNEACRFGNATGTVDAVVSQAGVFVNRITDSATGTTFVAIGFPEQAHTLADLKGDWNVIGLERNSTASGYNGITATLSVDLGGTVTAATWCENEATRSVAGADCQAVTSGLPSLSVSANGGFSSSGGGQLFVYTAATGTMALQIDADGSVQLRTPVQTLSAKVSEVVAIWGVSVSSTMNAGPVSSSSYTTTAFDAASGQLTRVSNDDGHTEVLVNNTPRTGFNHRAGMVDAPTTNPAGGKVQVREFTGLNLRHSLGFNALWLPQMMADQVAANALGQFNLSVQKP